MKRSEIVIGLKSIAAYLGYRSLQAPIAMARRYGLPIYRRPAATRCHRLVWVLDLVLYREWQREQVRLARRESASMYSTLHRWSPRPKPGSPANRRPGGRLQPAGESAAIEPTGASSSSQLEADPADRPEIDPPSR